MVGTGKALIVRVSVEITAGELLHAPMPLAVRVKVTIPVSFNKGVYTGLIILGLFRLPGPFSVQVKVQFAAVAPVIW